MLALALLIVTQATDAAATKETVATRIERGLQAHDTLEYETCATELMLAAGDPRASAGEKIRANLYAGICHRVLGRDTEARLSFVYVLKHAPETELPRGLAPKISTFFMLVREEILAAAPAPPTPALEPPATAVAAASEANAARAAAPPAGAADRGVLPLLGIVAGAVVGGAGALGFAVASVPWFEQDAAARELELAAAEHGDGSDARARYQGASAAWTTWGAAAATTGAVAIGVGAAAVVVAALFFEAPP